MTRFSSGLVPIIFLLSFCKVLCAQTLVIDSSRTLTADQLQHHTVHVVDGANPPTVLEIRPKADPDGSVSATLLTYDSSVVNSFARVAIVTRAYDSSTLNFYQRGFGMLSGYDSATINVFNAGYGEFSPVQVRGSSELNILGGSVDRAYSYDSATVNVFDGDVDLLQAEGASTVNIHGGHVGGLTGYDLKALYSSTMHIFGTEFNYPPGPIPDTYATLHGTLADGSRINTNLYIASHDASIILHYVPEPSTFWLTIMAALGLLACALRRRKTAP